MLKQAAKVVAKDGLAAIEKASQCRGMRKVSPTKIPSGKRQKASAVVPKLTKNHADEFIKIDRRRENRIFRQTLREHQRLLQRKRTDLELFATVVLEAKQQKI